MGKFTVIPEDTFDGLQMDAGVLLKTFNPTTAAAPADEDIICATTGGVNATCVPTFSDLGEDVDNCPINMKELKHLDSWECKLAFTALGTSPSAIKLALGCADIDTVDPTKIIPRADLKQSDFSDLWWVGDKADGGMVAIQLKNALSTAGFSLQTTKNGKGQISVELTGHVSINDQKTMPMVFYSASTKKTVSYNSNGGTGTMTDTNSPYENGATVTVMSNTFTAPDTKSFKSWNTKQDGTGTSYNAEATFKITADTVLYAIWE